MSNNSRYVRLEVRRQLAGRLLLEGRGVREVARLVKASASSVSRWKAALEEGGMDALKSKPHPGAKPRLDSQDKQKLERLLRKGPQTHGFTTDLWTCPRVALLIEQQFGVKYHPGYVWHLLRDLGWTCQKPEQRARERDEKAIRCWQRDEWPRIKKGASQAS